MSDFDLNRLYERITLRAHSSGVGDSYTADLFEKGIERIAQKLGEEATETLIAAISLKQNEQAKQMHLTQQENKQKKLQRALCEESADLLYHLCLLWYACDTKPQNVYEILAERAAKRDQESSEQQSQKTTATTPKVTIER